MIACPPFSLEEGTKRRQPQITLRAGTVQGPGQLPALPPPPAAVRRVVYLVDAAVQANDGRAGMRMQREVEQLKAQLAEMTGGCKGRSEGGKRGRGACNITQQVCREVEGERRGHPAICGSAGAGIRFMCVTGKPVCWRIGGLLSASPGGWRFGCIHKGRALVEHQPQLKQSFPGLTSLVHIPTRKAPQRSPPSGQYRPLPHFVACCLRGVRAEELERRTRVDRETQRQISRMLQAGEEDAQQRIEEGYREASQAVSKAL